MNSTVSSLLLHPLQNLLHRSKSVDQLLISVPCAAPKTLRLGSISKHVMLMRGGKFKLYLLQSNSLLAMQMAGHEKLSYMMLIGSCTSARNEPPEITSDS